MDCKLSIRTVGNIFEISSRTLAVDLTPPALVRVAAGELLASVGAELTALMGDWVSVAVIGPEALLPALGDVVPLSEGVSLLDPLGAKGLEFDAVIVVEPAAIFAEVNGARLLYVAMTRAVQELSLVHSEPLPAVLVA